jgi:hypothetical protein
MSTGITFDNITDAKDFQKMKMLQGEKVSIEPSGNKYIATVTGEFTESELPRDKRIGSGSYTLLGKDKLPPVSTRRTMDTYNLPYDVDPEIRDVIIELNRKGFKTIGNCAGHRDNGFLSVGKNGYNEKAVTEILKRHNLKILKIEADKNPYSVFYSFSPVGKIYQGGETSEETSEE